MGGLREHLVKHVDMRHTLKQVVVLWQGDIPTEELNTLLLLLLLWWLPSRAMQTYKGCICPQMLQQLQSRKVSDLGHLDANAPARFGRQVGMDHTLAHAAADVEKRARRAQPQNRIGGRLWVAEKRQ